MAMTLKEAPTREMTVRGGDDDDNTDIEEGDGKGGFGSPGHRGG